MATVTLRISLTFIVLMALVCVQAAILTGQPVLTTAHVENVAVPATQPAGDVPTDGGSGGGVTTIAETVGGPVAIERGKVLFNKFQPVAGAACAACHQVNADTRLVGPGLLNVGARAAGRVPGLTASAYLRQSILQPSAYVVDGYTDIMPKTFSKAFTDAQLDDLTTYLLSLR